MLLNCKILSLSFFILASSSAYGSSHDVVDTEGKPTAPTPLVESIPTLPAPAEAKPDALTSALIEESTHRSERRDLRRLEALKNSYIKSRDRYAAGATAFLWVAGGSTIATGFLSVCGSSGYLDPKVANFAITCLSLSGAALLWASSQMNKSATGLSTELGKINRVLGIPDDFDLPPVEITIDQPGPQVTGRQLI